MRIFAIYLILLSVIVPVFIPTIALAAINVPDEDFTINEVRAYRNAIEQDDLLIFVEYSIVYSTGTPTNYTAEDLFSCRMFEGTTYIDTTNPYSYGNVNDYGFNHGLMSFYFNSDDAEDLGLTWGDTYTFTLDGNPLIDWATGTPPSISKNGIDVSFDGNPYSNIDTQIRTRIGDYTKQFEDDWDLSVGDLADWTTGKPILSYHGEMYFSNVISDLSKISPSLFGTAETIIDYETHESYILQQCSGTQTIANWGTYKTLAVEYRAGFYFLAENTGYVDSVDTLVYKQGVGAGTITASLYNATAGGTPTGAALAHGVRDSTLFGTSPVFTKWTFGTPAKIITGEGYCIIFNAGTGNATNRMLQRNIMYNSCYDSFTSCYNNGVWVTYETTRDTPFILYRADDMESRSIAKTAEDDGMFDFTGLSDMFGVSKAFAAGIAALAFIFAFIMIKARNQAQSTRNVFIIGMFAMLGMSLLLPFGTGFIITMVALIALVALWSLLMKNAPI